MAKHFIAVERNGSMVFEEQDIDDYGKLIKKFYQTKMKQVGYML